MTKETSPDADALQTELKSVRRSFEILLLSIEADGPDKAREMTGKILERLEKLTRDIRETYVRDILERRFSPLRTEKEHLTAASGNDDFIAVVSRLEGHIGLIEREMNLLLTR